MKLDRREYQTLYQKQSPPSPSKKTIPAAFAVGGAICLLGQVLKTVYQNMGLDEKAAGTAVSISLIFLGVALTACRLFEKIAKFAGAGTLVPITGFANAIAAPAVEFKTDECAIIGPSRKAFISGEYDDLVQKSISAKAVHTYNVGGIRNCSRQFDTNNFLPATQVMIPNGFCHTVRYFFFNPIMI